LLVRLDIDFQPEGAATAPGYTADSGEAYDPARGYGWVDAATGAPLSLVGNGRVRNLAVDQRLDTFMSMQLPPGSPGVETPGAWRAAVPDGTYAVIVGAGDPSAIDSRHVVRLEGRTVLDFTPDAATRSQIESAIVTVTDGFLDVDATGGTNTKLDFIQLQAVDHTAPAAVAGLVAVAGPDGNVTVSWSASPADDLASYRVYRGSSAAVDTSGTPLSGPLAATTFVDTTAPAGQTSFYVVEARDSSGNRSPASAVAAATPRSASAFVLNVNFQPHETATPAGYVADAGEPYDAARRYGWADAVTAAPLSLVGNARVRGLDADPRLDTLISMQLAPGSPGVGTPGSWRAAVPDGTYAVTVGSGDPEYTDSHDVVNVEGRPAIDFTPSATEHTRVATVQVHVTDGFLDVDATGGTNTKLAYITIAALTAADPAAALTITSPDDVLGVGTRLVFSTVKRDVRPSRSVTLTNSGTVPLAISDIAIAGSSASEFTLCGGQATTFALAVGATATVCVQYRPTIDVPVNSAHVDPARIAITAGDAPAPHVVTLGGLDAAYYEGTNEPTLQQIFDALGYGDDAAVINRPIWASLGPSSTPVGDEVLSATWTRADPRNPVTLLPVGRYSGKVEGADSQPFGWYAQGSSTPVSLFTMRGGNATGGQNDGYGQNQMLLPAADGPTTFAPSGAFGLVESSGTHSDDALNASGWHNARAFPAKDATGKVIDNAYLVAMDPGSPVQNSPKNWDYNDFVLLMLNVKPAGATSGQPAPGEMDRTLASFTGSAGGLAGTGFTTAQGTVDAAKLAFSGGRLLVTSSNDTNTSHTNALQLGVNAGTSFRVQSRLVGPFTAIDAGAEQQGIYFGPDGRNYLKAEVEHDGAGGRALTIWKEKDGSGAILDTIPLPGGDASTIDLRITVTPSPPNDALPTATISYALNGAATFTTLGTATTLPTGWITANTPAGIVASHQQGGSPFTATFASFTVERTY
jgi:hypothetical protein